MHHIAREPTHPGEILWEEFLRPLGISQEEFAAHLGGSWTQPKVSSLINKRRNITKAISLDFADALGTSPQFWLNLQTQYDLWQAQKRRRKIPMLPAIRRSLGKRAKKVNNLFDCD